MAFYNISTAKLFTLFLVICLLTVNIVSCVQQYNGSKNVSRKLDEIIMLKEREKLCGTNGTQTAMYHTEVLDAKYLNSYKPHEIIFNYLHEFDIETDVMEYIYACSTEEEKFEFESIVDRYGISSDNLLLRKLHVYYDTSQARKNRADSAVYYPGAQNLSVSDHKRPNHGEWAHSLKDALIMYVVKQQGIAALQKRHGVYSSLP